MMKFLKSIVDALAEVALPRLCCVCGKHLPKGEDFLCLKCFYCLPRTNFSFLPLNQMEERLGGLIPFKHASALLYYSPNTDVARLVADFKYRHRPGLTEILAARLAYEISDSGFFSGIDCILPVPLHFTKFLKRSYNQSEFLALGISRATGIPVEKELKAIRPHRTQTSLSHEQRKDNTIGIFRLRNPHRFKGKHILLVDDIFTTGSTVLAAASEILNKQPDATISILTLGYSSQG